MLHIHTFVYSLLISVCAASVGIADVIIGLLPSIYLLLLGVSFHLFLSSPERFETRLRSLILSVHSTACIEFSDCVVYVL